MLSVEELESQTHDLARSLGLSNEVVEQAVAYATRAYAEHPINRAPSSIAAGAVYWAALLENEKRTQRAVADAADTTEVSIRATYREIAEYEGSRLPEPDTPRSNRGAGRPPSLFQRAGELLRGGE